MRELNFDHETNNTIRRIVVATFIDDNKNEYERECVISAERDDDDDSIYDWYPDIETLEREPNFVSCVTENETLDTDPEFRLEYGE